MSVAAVDAANPSTTNPTTVLTGDVDHSRKMYFSADFPNKNEEEILLQIHGSIVEQYFAEVTCMFVSEASWCM